jgi:hypothetical protein
MYLEAFRQNHPERKPATSCTSAILKSSGVVFEPAPERTWHLVFQGKTYTVTFYPEVFNEKPSLHLMNFGDPLFEELLRTALTFVHGSVTKQDVFYKFYGRIVL